MFGTAKQAEKPANLRAISARTRLQSARHNANYLHDACAHAMSGVAFRNFAAARVLRPLQLDLTRRTLVHPTSTAPAWTPPKGAELFVELLAMVVTHWKIPKGEPNAGESYRGIYASAEEIAAALGISKNQWNRGPYWRDDKLVSRGGAREWLQHHRLIACYTTTNRRLPAALQRPFGEGRYYTEPGPALLELLGMHRRRVARNRRRVLRASKGSQNLGSKSFGISSVLRTEDLPPHRARPRSRKLPMVRQWQRVHPECVGVDEQTRRRSKSNEEPDGHEGRGSPAVGGELEAPRQREPLPPGEAQTVEGVSTPPPADPVAEALAGLLAQLTPPRPSPAPPRPPTPPAGETPPAALGAMLERIGGVDVRTLIPRMAGQLDEREGRRRRGARGGGGAAAAPSPIGAALAGLLGGERSPDERAENERRREAAKARARAEAEGGSPGGEVHAASEGDAVDEGGDGGGDDDAS